MTERWQGMFCMDALATKFDLEYWDCTDVCKPAYEASTVLYRDYTRIIKDREDMRNQLSRLPKDTVILSHILLGGYNYELHRLISSYNKNRVGVDFWANSMYAFLKETTEQLDREKEGHFSSLHKKIDYYLSKIPILFYGVKFIELGGGEKFRAFKDEDKKTRRYFKSLALYKPYQITVKPRTEYSINHPDYEKYLGIIQSNENPLIEGKYIVFLDQYYPKHPTLKTENPEVDFDVLAQPYYESLNSFFDKIEMQYKCRVIIAGHPIANYEHNPFGGRQIIYYKTAELVSASIGVLMHYSFSVSFPILFNKPLCLITNKALAPATEIKRNQQRFSTTFNQKIVNTDDVANVAGVVTPIEDTIREKYINTFFDTSIKEKNEVILQHHIEKIHNEIIKI